MDWPQRLERCVQTDDGAASNLPCNLEQWDPGTFIPTASFVCHRWSPVSESLAAV